MKDVWYVVSRAVLVLFVLSVVVGTIVVALAVLVNPI